MILRIAKKILHRTPLKIVRSDVSSILSNVFGHNNYLEGQDSRRARIDIIIQDGKSLPKSSAFIRLLAPLTHPLIADKISLNICENTSDLRDDVQIIIIQRAVISSSEEAQSLVKLTKDKNLKLIVDTDDAFFSLDKNHPNYDELHNKHDALLHLIKNADQLWVSTENLKKYYQKICKTPIYILPNTLDSRVWKKNNVKNLPDKLPLRLLYMGTATHEEDLQMIIPWLDKLHEKHLNSFELHIIGVSSKLPKKPWLKPMTRSSDKVIYPNFAKWIQSQGPFDLGLAPLVNSKFNKYKSDIKCLDYLAIGAVPIVSKIDPYSNKELDEFVIRNPNNQEAWLKSIEEIILNIPRFRQKKLRMLRQGQNYVWQKRSSEIAAKQIADLLEIN